MVKAVVSKTVLLVGIITAILVSSMVLTAVSSGFIDKEETQGNGTQQQNSKGDTGETAPAEVASVNGTVTRYVYEGSFNLTEDGDLIESRNGVQYHWKRIDVPELTLTSMPLVQVYETTVVNQTVNPVTLWRGEGASYISHADEVGLVLHDEGCVYIYYKMTGEGAPIYAVNGDYKVVVIK